MQGKGRPRKKCSQGRPMASLKPGVGQGTRKKKEPAQRGIVRSIQCMEKWALEKETDWHNYFRAVSPQLAIHHIRGGKVSPWLIFLSESGQNLWANLNEEQITLIKDIADPTFWRRIFLKNPEEVTLVQDIVEASNL